MGLLSPDWFSAPPNTIGSIGEEAGQVSMASESQVQLETSGWSILTLLGSLQMEVSRDTDQPFVIKQESEREHSKHSITHQSYLASSSLQYVTCVCVLGEG